MGKREGLTEPEIANRVIQYLTEFGWDCYPEVQWSSYSPRADIVATHKGLLWIIECKTVLGLNVMEQASKWLWGANFVSVATNRSRNWFSRDVLKKYGIGWFEVAEDFLTTPVLPNFYRNRFKTQIEYLHEGLKQYQAGGTSATGWYSPWKNTMEQTKRLIQSKPGITLKEIMAGITHHYQSDAGAKSSIRHWLEVDKSILGYREGKSIRYKIIEQET